MRRDDGSDVDGSQLGAPSEDDPPTVGAGRSRAPRRIVAVLIALVISGDVGAIVVRRNQSEPGLGRLDRAAPVLFRDDFSATTVFRAADDEFDSGVQDGTFRLRPERGIDEYILLPEEAPDRPKVLQTQDVSVAVDVQMSPDTDDWFGIFCRFGGFGTDTYVARVMTDGSWTIVRTTIGDEYVRRVLGGGGAPGIGGPLPADATAHLRLDCVGQVETSLHFR